MIQLLSAALLAVPQSAPALSVEDIMEIRTIESPRISPDGNRVAYVIAEPDLTEDRYNTNIWLVTTDGGEPTRMTNAGRDRAPRWSPDGSHIAFAGSRGNTSQIWLIRPDGGEAWKLSDHETGVQSFAWSPDGNRIAFTALKPDSTGNAESEMLLDDSVLFDRVHRLSQIFVLDVASGRKEQITDGAFTVTAFSWSPDGDEIAFSAQPTPKVPDIYLSDIFVVSLSTGDVRDLVVRPGIDWQPQWSPDGQTIAFSSEDGTDDWIANNYICVVPAEGGSPRNIGRAHDGLVVSFTWTANSEELFFSATRGVRRHLYALSARTGTIRQISSGDRVFSNVTLGGNDVQLAFLAQDPGAPAELYASPARRFAPTRLTDANPFLRERSLGDVEIVEWDSPDGTVVEGILMKPVGMSSSQRYPLLTYVHGGPASQFTMSFNPSVSNGQRIQGSPYPVQVFAGQGYAVFFPNPRGSNGYGQAFRMAVVGEWGYADYDDVQSGIDHLVERGIADADRLGIMGWSYGGYMTGWTIARTNRFRAASVGAGMSNLVSFYGQTDIPRYLERYLGDVPWQDTDVYQRHSTIVRAADITTPTLIQHGARDARVPLAQGRELYRALFRRGVPVEFAIYPDQGHSITRPRLQADANQRNLEWFNQWLQPLSSVPR